MSVLLAGEGVDELGDWFHHAAYRTGSDHPGILEAFLAVITPAPRVANGYRWTQIRKFRAGQHLQPETRNVLGLALDASEAGHSQLVFARDRDGDSARESDLEQGISKAQRLFPELRIAGGVAAQQIEAWILAVLGELCSELHGDAKSELRKRFGIIGRAEKVNAITSAALARVPPDAVSLNVWLDRLAKAFAV